MEEEVKVGRESGISALRERESTDRHGMDQGMSTSGICGSRAGMPSLPPTKLWYIDG